MDVAFMGDEDIEEVLTMLAAKRKTREMVMSAVLQAQSSGSSLRN